MLTGDLTDFSLREILQFLATTSASGILELRSDASHAGIALREGGICLALLDLQGVGGLAARMLHADVVDVTRLRTVGEQGGGSAVALATILAAAAGDADATAGIYREHTHETLGWLTRWDSATFQFQRSSDLDGWPFDAMAVASALAEVDTRASDWDDLRETVGDLALVASATPNPTDIDEISLTPEQWRLISLVDGRRAVVDLIELSGVGHLRTCRLLHELVTAGLVELVEPGTASTLSILLGGLQAVGARTASTSSPSVLRAAGRPTAAPPTAGAPEPAEAPVLPQPVPAAAPAAAPALSASPATPSVPAATVPAADTMPTGDANQDMLQRLLGGSGEGS